jgi:iron(III) transport system substrate-binding protein
VRRRTFLTGIGAAGILGVQGGCRSPQSTSQPAEYLPDRGALQVYSAQHQNLTKPWAEAFTAKTGIKVQIRQGQDASMGHQIMAEGDSSPADVFLTENSPAMTLVERARLLAEVDEKTRQQVPKDSRPSSNCLDGGRRPIYSSGSQPGSPRQARRPGVADGPSRSGVERPLGCAAGGADFQSIVAGMLAYQGEAKTNAWLTGLKANARILQNNIATMKSVNAGELPCGVIFHYYWYRDQAATKEGSGNTALHYFRNPDPGAFVSLSGGGVLASAAKPAEAQQFLAIITSREGQRVLVESRSMEYAVGIGAASDPALPPLSRWKRRRSTRSSWTPRKSSP